MPNKFDSHSNKLVFEFASKEAANHFKRWLCGQGEQDYWLWMECREDESDGDITGLEFNYHTGNDTIPVECGRMDKDD